MRVFQAALPRMILPAVLPMTTVGVEIPELPLHPQNLDMEEASTFESAPGWFLTTARFPPERE